MSELQTASQQHLIRRAWRRPPANLAFRGFVLGDIVRVEYPQSDNLQAVDGLAGYRGQEGILIGQTKMEGGGMWWVVSFVGRTYQFFNCEIGLVLPSPLVLRLPLTDVLPELLQPGKGALWLYEMLTAGGWEQLWRLQRSSSAHRKRRTGISPHISWAQYFEEFDRPRWDRKA